MVAEGFSDIPTDFALVSIITVFLLLMFLGGVVGTIYFVVRPGIGRAERQAVDSSTR
jgi:hypothetical protein